MSNLRFELPSSIDKILEDGKVAKFRIKPLERGYGITVGNALRRVLLASIPGAAIVNISIEGVEHEFSTIHGVYEDVMGIVLNLKEIIFKVDSNDPNFKQTLELEVSDKEVVTAGDFKLYTGTEIINPDLVICHLMKGTKFSLTAELRLGVGYVSSDENKIHNTAHGQIAIDSIFSPIKRVSYFVEKVRGDKDELNLEIETNGAIEAKDSLAIASSILIQHFQLIQKISENAGQVEYFDEKVEVEEQKFEDVKIDDLNLTARLYNSLKKQGILTVQQLLSTKEEDIRKFRGLGRKSCEELKAKLQSLGLSLKNGFMESFGDDEEENQEEYVLDTDLDYHEDDQEEI